MSFRLIGNSLNWDKLPQTKDVQLSGVNCILLTKSYLESAYTITQYSVTRNYLQFFNFTIHATLRVIH